MSATPSAKGLVLLNWLSFLLTLFFNAMANILPINGLNTGQVSALYPNFFVPDGFTFSIWSVIYTWLLLFVIVSSSWLLSSKASQAKRSAAAQLSPLFIISGFVNVSWILAWHYLQVWLSLGLMLVLLTLLFLQFRRIQQATATASAAIRWLLFAPFVIYFGWISVATIANTTALLVHFGWQGGPLEPAVWSAVMMSVAGILALLVGAGLRQPLYAAVVVWAMLGIYRAQQTTTPWLGQVALVVAAVAALASIAGFWLAKANNTTNSSTVSIQ
ncbi:hypothetical protein [Phnomibacter sp. MR]|uniref:hypothetical protein n=1 Tax=Phnomibacter sp. MR TaxID=3042318 RepID=UPI003A7FF6C4